MPLENKKPGQCSWMTASPDRYSVLKAFALENRKHQTDAEKAVWNLLRGKSLGKQFLRQHIIGDVIVDFLCPEAKLIIEVDGGYHAEREQQEADEIRQMYLEVMGYKVIRFKNEEVLHSTDQVIEKIRRLLDPSLLP